MKRLFKSSLEQQPKGHFLSIIMKQVCTLLAVGHYSPKECLKIFFHVITLKKKKIWIKSLVVVARIKTVCDEG